MGNFHFLNKYVNHVIKRVSLDRSCLVCNLMLFNVCISFENSQFQVYSEYVDYL